MLWMTGIRGSMSEMMTFKISVSGGIRVSTSRPRMLASGGKTVCARLPNTSMSGIAAWNTVPRTSVRTGKRACPSSMMTGHGLRKALREHFDEAEEHGLDGRPRLDDGVEELLDDRGELPSGVLHEIRPDAVEALGAVGEAVRLRDGRLLHLGALLDDGGKPYLREGGFVHFVDVLPSPIFMACALTVASSSLTPYSARASPFPWMPSWMRVRASVSSIEKAFPKS